jgi:anaerobic selenocysteine-containing dehydrogenase
LILEAVDLFNAIGDRRIKAVWIIGANPVDSIPDATTARAALQACPFVVISNVIADTDTNAHEPVAHARETFCEIHLDDAAPLGIAHSNLVKIASGAAACLHRCTGRTASPRAPASTPCPILLTIFSPVSPA